MPLMNMGEGEKVDLLLDRRHYVAGHFLVTLAHGFLLVLLTRFNSSLLTNAL